MVITMVPTLIVYVLFQRRLESGLTAGALKGWTGYRLLAISY
jgi:ABC-type glycerol-3-phosphate transport system permease component